MAFPVIRAPNSSFAFWVSMVPFFAPITMMVRIVSQTPPFWQIALSLGDRIRNSCAVALAVVANLSRRHADVREEGDDPGSRALGAAELMGSHERADADLTPAFENLAQANRVSGHK